MLGMAEYKKYATALRYTRTQFGIWAIPTMSAEAVQSKLPITQHWAYNLEITMTTVTLQYCKKLEFHVNGFRGYYDPHIDKRNTIMAKMLYLLKSNITYISETCENV